MRAPSRSAFHSQQAAECALKAATIALSDDHQRTHSLRVLLRELETLGEVDALALVNDGDPAEFVDATTARGALERGTRILAYATSMVDRVEREPRSDDGRAEGQERRL